MRKFSLQHSTATSRAKGGVTKRKKCNTQRKPGYPKVMGKIDPERRRGGTLRLMKIVKKEFLQKLRLWSIHMWAAGNPQARGAKC